MRPNHLRRRELITLLGSTAAAWPLAARAQQPAMPVIGYIGFGSLDNSVLYLAAFRKGLGETGFIEGQNVAIDYRWLEGQYDRMSELAADLVRRGVTVIATPGTPPASVRAAMATTATIPIVFAVGDDPVKWGIVASLGRPNSNTTGINFLNGEVVAKRLGLLHDLVPRAARIAVLLNSADPTRAASMLLATWRPPLALSHCKCKFSMPALAARSMPLSERSHASAPKLFLSAPTASSIPDACSSRCWRRGMRFRRPMRCVNMRRLAAVRGHAQMLPQHRSKQNSSPVGLTGLLSAITRPSVGLPTYRDAGRRPPDRDTLFE